MLKQVGSHFKKPETMGNIELLGPQMSRRVQFHTAGSEAPA